MTDYWTGYLLALQNSAAANAQLAQGAKWSIAYQNGLLDGLNRIPPRDPSGFVPTAAQIPAGVVIPGRKAPVYTPRPGATGGSVYVPSPAAPPPRGPILPVQVGLVPGNFPVYEVYATVPLLGGVPFDTAESYEHQAGGGWLQTLERNLVKFTLLGADPSDSRDGFRLSGPRGPLAQRIAQAIQAAELAPYPTAYGLSAWYGARTTRGIRILGPQQLQALGLL